MELWNAVYDFVAGPVLGGYGPLGALLMVLVLLLGALALVWGAAMLMVVVLTLALSVAGLCFVAAVFVFESALALIALRAKRKA